MRRIMTNGRTLFGALYTLAGCVIIGSKLKQTALNPLAGPTANNSVCYIRELYGCKQPASDNNENLPNETVTPMFISKRLAFGCDF